MGNCCSSFHELGWNICLKNKQTNKQKTIKKEQKNLKRSSQTMLTQRETRMTEDGEDW